MVAVTRTRGWIPVAALLVLGMAGAAEARQQRAPIAGVWTLDKDLSDDPQLVRPAQERRGGGGGGAPAGRGGGRGGGGGGRGGGFVGAQETSDGSAALNPEYMRQVAAMLQELLEEPGQVAIEVTDVDVAFTSAEGHVERFKTNNAKEKHHLTSGTTETKTRWDRGKLLKDTSLLGLATVHEQYGTDASGHLELDIKVERVRVPDPFVFKLVYDRAAGK